MKKILFFLILIIIPFYAFADFKDTVEKIRGSYVEPVFYTIIAIVFLIGVLVNIGKIWGTNRDYAEFFKQIILYLAVALAIGSIYVTISSLTL